MKSGGLQGALYGEGTRDHWSVFGCYGPSSQDGLQASQPGEKQVRMAPDAMENRAEARRWGAVALNLVSSGAGVGHLRASATGV